MSAAAPLPFVASVKRFWPQLVPMALFPSFLVVLVLWRHDRFGIAIMSVVFIASLVIGMVPVLRGRAGFSFWLLAIGCSIAFAPLALLAVRAAYSIFGPPPP